MKPVSPLARARWLFSSDHLADYPAAVASGFIAGTATVGTTGH